MADESKKTSRLVRKFKSEGSADLTPRVTMNASGIVFTVANGKSVEANLADFFGGVLPPAGIGRACAAYGLNATIGGATGNLDGEDLSDPDEVLDAITSRINTLKAGNWASERTGGGRPSMVWAAFQEFRQSKGIKDTPEKLSALHAQWFENEENHKSLLKNAEFSAFLAAHKAKKAKPGVAAANADLLA